MICHSTRAKWRKSRRGKNAYIVGVAAFVFLFVIAVTTTGGAKEEPDNAPPAIVTAATDVTDICDGNIETTDDKDDFVALPVDMPGSEQRIVWKICKDYGIDFVFVMALIGHETEFTKDARSITGDSGYMQINDICLEEMERRGFTDMTDTADNVGAGVSILRDYMDKYDGNKHKVLMAYNMGATGAAKLWAQGITSSEYSREVMERYEEYNAIYNAIMTEK